MNNGTGTVPAVAVISARPGRLRLRFNREPGFRGCVAECAEKLAALDSVTGCRAAPDAASVIVHYVPEQDASEIVRTIVKIAGASVAPPPVPRKASSRPGAQARVPRLQVLHDMPGRLRLQVNKLSWNDSLGSRLKDGLSREHGILGVETGSRTSFVIVRYDPSVHLPANIVRMAANFLALAAQTSEGHAEFTRARDIPSEERSGLNPLLMPTLAIALIAPGIISPLITTPVLAIAALPIATRALKDLFARRASVDQLDFSALVVMMLIGQFFAASLMTWLIGLGDYIRARTMRKSRRAIGELLSPAGQRAWKECNGEIKPVPVEELVAGDIVLVYPGDLIPVDGVVVHGKALVDQKILTGESVPISREPGDNVFALTTIADGQVAVRVEHIGRETRAGQVASLIEDAPLSDTRVQNYAAMLGDRLVIPWFLLAGATYLVTADPMRLAAVLVLDFATGIRVSAPTTILSAMVAASHHGLFIKGGKAMEQLARIDAIVFDKTGTLTIGSPRVTEVYSFESGISENEVLRLAACAEANLKHPAAKAIVTAAEECGLTIESPVDMEYALGLGVNATIAGRRVQAGSRRHMLGNEIDISASESVALQCAATARSMVFVAVDRRLIGLVAYTDPPRSESAEVVQALLDRGVKRIVMLTGDTAASAHSVAGNLKITDVIADAFPEQKADVVEKLRSEGYTVGVIGDGVNDSPAFTRANVGISVAHGADVAKETADVILLDSNLWGLPRAIDLSRSAMGILKQNINIIVAPTSVGLVASVLGFSTPLLSTLINNGTTVLAGLNALRPLSSAHKTSLRTMPRLLTSTEHDRPRSR